MLYTTQLAIIFECKVAESGYMLLNSNNNDQNLVHNNLINAVFPKRKALKIDLGSNLLEQRVKGQTPRVKPFSYEAVQDFLALGEYSNHHHFCDARISFCNKWGPLIKIREDEVMFKKSLDILLDCEDAKQKSEFPAFSFSTDPLKQDFQILSWDYDRTERLVPAFKPTSLFNAIYLAWGLTAQSRKARKICKYFKFYGSRKNCSHCFQDTRGDREFCSRNCSNAFRQKPDWQEKVRRDIGIRIKKSRIKFERVSNRSIKKSERPTLD